MPGFDDPQTKIRKLRTRGAIELAVAGKWREAVTANQEIVAEFPNEVDAYNRLGRAYLELGSYSQARAAYQRTLELDSANTIARKNLDRLSQLGEDTEVPDEETTKVEPRQFLEETGKTGTAVLERPAPPAVLARLDAGDKLDIKLEGSRLKAYNPRGDYIAQLGPRDAHRLIKLIQGGNTYSATVTGVNAGRVSVIIREAFRHPSQAHLLSFPPRGNGQKYDPSLNDPDAYVDEGSSTSGFESDDDSDDTED
jgi:tetratricopeptide (TPR) repeat protein